MQARLLPSLLLLVACGQQVAPPANETAAAPSAKTAAPAKAFAVDEKNELIDFHFAWSREAAAVPSLVDRFQQEMKKARSELLAGAEQDKVFRDEKGFDFNGFMSTTDYRTAGQSAALLSLSVESGSYTGGAHGNFGVGSLLWDRAAAREIEPADLFAQPANMDRLLTQRWCDALNKAREEKRGEAVGTDGLFDDCPSLGDIAIIPQDKDVNGRFERLMLVASPYVAGPWVEGAYEVELGLTPDLLAALKDAYRTGFEAAHTQ